MNTTQTRNRVIGAGLLAATLLVPARAHGQDLSLEGRIGSSIPTGDLTDEAGPSQTAGLSFAIEGMVTLGATTTAYAGVSHHAFNCDGCTSDVSSTGLNAGLKLLVGDGRATPWLRGGLMLHRADLADVDEEWGLGVDAGVGVDWRVTRTLSVVPALRLNSYGIDPLTLTYVTVDLGLHLHPGS